MLHLIEKTNLTNIEKDEFVNLMLLVAKKLVATWKHLREYERIEDELIEKARAGKAIEEEPVQRLNYSQDLFLEIDEFLVQGKSTLDYLVKVPVPIVGRCWNLRTFAKKGETVRNALKGILPAEYNRTAKMIEEQVLDRHVGWLGMTIEARDKLNHLLDGGADFRQILVVKSIVGGVEKIHVPLWDHNHTAREVLIIVNSNLQKLVEDFTVGFMTARLKEGMTLVHVPVERESVMSPWKIMSEEEFEALQKEKGGETY
ncbi:MAG TPA: hypothetical protein VK612_07115 [Pyrinomonadaceae bacterium]|nr:hypothetical protein [Pyrinomonadaceae bacterium]